MKIWAGCTLNHRKPIRAPTIRAQKTARLGWAAFVPGTSIRAMSRYATKLKTRSPEARPSSPSVRFTALDVATMAKATNTTTTKAPTASSPTSGTLMAVMSKWRWM